VWESTSVIRCGEGGMAEVFIMLVKAGFSEGNVVGQ
jgi:hypothetical protein